MLKELINGLLEIIIDPSPRANLREKPKEDKLNYVEGKRQKYIAF